MSPSGNNAGDENQVDFRYVLKVRKQDLLRGQDRDVKGSGVQDDSRVWGLSQQKVRKTQKIGLGGWGGKQELSVDV